MIEGEARHAPPAARVVQRRMRGLGFLLIGSDSRGELCQRPLSGSDWLADLCCTSPLFAAALRDAAARWADEDHPPVHEALPGLHLVGMPHDNRRRRLGYTVAVLPTESFIRSEQFSAMCQAARQDARLTARLVAQLPPVAESEIERIATMVRSIHDDNRRLTADSRNMEHVSQQLADSYEEINLLYTIIQNMRMTGGPARFISNACEELLATLPYAWIGAQMAPSHDRLKRLAGRLVVAGTPPTTIERLREPARALVASAEAEVPTVLEPAFRPEDRSYRRLGDTVIVHPISGEAGVIGVLIAGQKQGDDTAASSVDMKLLAATASNMAIFLENAALYDDLNAMFLGTVEALTSSIDAKDRYTSGHSMRVAELTQQLASSVGLDEQTVERMRIAGLVHDVGKIGVPEHVLLKPGKLTEEEFAWIRRHPEIGHRILRDIPQLADVLPGVLHHHERWDGRGYPEGLAGDRIPLVARIIALADSFDAMSSTRTYRDVLSRDQVIDEINACAGAQFDPELARVFVELDFDRYDALVAMHLAPDSSAVDPEAA